MPGITPAPPPGRFSEDRPASDLSLPVAVCACSKMIDVLAVPESQKTRKSLRSIAQAIPHCRRGVQQNDFMTRQRAGA